MTKQIIRTIFLLLIFGHSLDNFSQTGSIFFSVTGDTICYCEQLGQEVDSLHLSLDTYIKCSDKMGFAKTISSFQLICEASNTCIQTLNKDTVKKYHLQLDGTDGVWGPKNDFIISVLPTNTKLVDTSAFGPKFIYQTTVVANISCKGKKLYSKEFEVMFKGNSANDFRQFDFVTVRAWRKKNTKKYYVDLNIKEHQTFKKPGDLPDYKFKGYQFIL